MLSTRTMLSCTLLLGMILTVGCSSLWHELQPHRIQRLNRGPAPSLDPEFSGVNRSNSNRLAKQMKATSSPKLSANSAETVTVRAQND